MKKKVAIISRALHINGATKALVEMLRRVDYEKAEIDLFVLDFSEPAEEWIAQIPKNVTIKSIPQYHIRKDITFQVIRYPLHFAKALVAGKKLKKEKNIIKQWKYTAQRLPIIKERYDIAISFRHFDIDVFYVIQNIKAKKKYFWIHGVQQMKSEEVRILNPYYKKYNGVFPVSISAKNNIERFFPYLKEKCNIAYCVVDSTEIKEKAEGGVGFPDDENVVHLLTIGRLGTEKGIDIAIKAARILKERNIKFKWYVAGEGNQREVLLKMINDYDLQDNFILLGNVNNPYKMLRDCLIYIQPSRLESYGLAVNEAKILHKPIVCSDIPAGREQIIQNKNGFLVNTSEKDFADAIENLIRNPKMIESLEKNLKGKDWSHFEAVEIFNKIVADEN